MIQRLKGVFKRYKFWIPVLLGLAVLFDIFVLIPVSDLVIFLLTGLWVLSVWLCRFEGKISIIGSLIFLSLCPFLLIFDKEPIAEKSAIWAYMFLVIGVAQEFIEYLRENRKKQR